MVLVGLDSRRLRVNSAFCRMLGYSDAEMLSQTMHLTHPEDFEFDVVQRRRALAGEIETYQREKRYQHHSGSTVWAYVTCSLVRDADRKPLHFISQALDITDRKRIDQTLRDSEERFRALTELSSDWYWEQDENFRFTQVSDKIDRVTGAAFSQRDAVGKTPWELGYLNDSADLIARHERHETFRNFELNKIGRDGRIRYLSVSGVPIYDAAGRFSGYRGVGHDNTDLRRVTEKLRSSEKQLREITDTVPALIAYVDSNQCFRFHNRAYEEAFGLMHEQIDGHSLSEVLGIDAYQNILVHVQDVMRGYPVRYERTQKTARGGWRDYAVNYFPRYGDDDEGKVIGFYSLATDITELKQLDRMKSEIIGTFSPSAAANPD